jgi:hypothetical protein
MRTFSARVKSQFGRGKGKKERKERTFGLERTSSRRVDDEATSRQPLSDLRQRQGQSSGSEGEESENGTNVVVRVSFQLDSDARCQERSQRLTRRSTAMDVDGVARKTFLSIPLRDVVGERRPECTVRVDNVDVVDTDGETLSEGELVGGGRNVSSEGKREKTKETHLSLVDELVVETEVELKSVLYSSIKVEREEGNARRSTGTHRKGGLEKGAEVDRSRLGVAEGVVDAKEVAPSNHLVDCPEPEFGHDRAELFGDVVEEVDDVLRLPCRRREVCERGREKRGKEEKRTGELGTKNRVLSGDSDGASVEVALAHLWKGENQIRVVGRGGKEGRTMMQPIAMRGVVAKPHSSAPSKQAIATSRPVRICPSVWRAV